ncbi:MAG: rod shape-determining protein MreD [Planctomycetota bacterium]|jgi:rod shape-determining protein MreD
MRLSIGLPLACLLLLLQVWLEQSLGSLTPPLLLLLTVRLTLTLSRDDIAISAFLLGVLHDLAFGLHLGVGTALFLLFAAIVAVLRPALPHRSLLYQFLFSAGLVFLFRVLEPLFIYRLDALPWLLPFLLLAAKTAALALLLTGPLLLLLHPLPLILPGREEGIQFSGRR